jgi:glycosyltransferase involved in cell wall biosynthesis
MEKITATIITKNNEEIIERCLKSVTWTDEIVVVDSGSTDNTLEICEKYNCKVIRTPWLGFGKTKQLAEDNASNDWILSIDSDEICTPELKSRLLSILSDPDSMGGYRIKRRTFYLGKPIKYCGWQKDFPLRMYKKSVGGFNDREIHEFVELRGQAGKIKEQILHYSYPSISDHLQKIDRYTSLGAVEAISKGKTSSPLLAIMKGHLKFFKMFVMQRGFLDGPTGYILAKNSAFGVYLKYLKIFESGRKK